MAPNKRSHSPTKSSRSSDKQFTQQSSQQHEIAMREISIIALENQQLLRELVHNNHQRANSSVRSQGQRVSSTHSVQNFVPPVQPKVTPIIRHPVQHVPRRSNPALQATHKICWYHRQFGRTSANCIQPCIFTDPVVPQPDHQVPVVAPAQPVAHPVQYQPTEEVLSPQSTERQVSSVVVRLPLERTLCNSSTVARLRRLSLSDSSSSEAEAESSSSKKHKSADWNKMVREEAQSSNSSSSDSEDSQKVAVKTKQ